VIFWIPLPLHYACLNGRLISTISGIPFDQNFSLSIRKRELRLSAMQAD